MRPYGEPSSKFKLKFKEALKAKGRPKKKTNQLVFNRTSLDKKKEKKRGNGKRKKSLQALLQDMHSNKSEESDDAHEDGTAIDSSSSLHKGFSLPSVDQSDAVNLRLSSEYINEITSVSWTWKIRIDVLHTIIFPSYGIRCC